MRAVRLLGGVSVALCSLVGVRTFPATLRHLSVPLEI